MPLRCVMAAVDSCGSRAAAASRGGGRARGSPRAPSDLAGGALGEPRVRPPTRRSATGAPEISYRRYLRSICGFRPLLIRGYGPLVLHAAARGRIDNAGAMRPGVAI